MRPWRRLLGLTGLTLATASALAAMILLALLFSGKLTSPDYESFLSRQETILRIISWLLICSIAAIPIAIFDPSRRLAITITTAILTLVPMSILFFITSMARF
jgi:membrane protein YdbS with pleckstrin-like domain